MSPRDHSDAGSHRLSGTIARPRKNSIHLRSCAFGNSSAKGLDLGKDGVTAQGARRVGDASDDGLNKIDKSPSSFGCERVRRDCELASGLPPAPENLCENRLAPRVDSSPVNLDQEQGVGGFSEPAKLFLGIKKSPVAFEELLIRLTQCCCGADFTTTDLASCLLHALEIWRSRWLEGLAADRSHLVLPQSLGSPEPNSASFLDRV